MELAQSKVSERAIQLSVKELFLFAPLGGGILAIAYDVGYFSGVDLRFFSFFSLSEHLTFALEAFPSAALISAAFLLSAILILTRAANDAVSSRKRRRPRNRRNVWRLILYAILIYYLAATMFAVIWEELELLAVINASSVLVITFILIHREPANPTKSKVMKLAVLSAANFVLATFLFGFFAAKIYLVTDANNHVIWMADAEGRVGKVLRSGERGILYFDQQADRVVFVERNLITKIEREKSPVKGYEFLKWPSPGGKDR